MGAISKLLRYQSLKEELEEEVFEIAEDIIYFELTNEFVISRLKYLEPYEGIIGDTLLEQIRESTIQGHETEELELIFQIAASFAYAIETIKQVNELNDKTKAIKKYLDHALNSTDPFRTLNAFQHTALVILGSHKIVIPQETSKIGNDLLRTAILVMTIVKDGGHDNDSMKICEQVTNARLDDAKTIAFDLNSYLRSLNIYKEDITEITTQEILTIYEVLEELSNVLLSREIEEQYHQALDDIFNVIKKDSNIKTVSSAIKSIELVVLDRV